MTSCIKMTLMKKQISVIIFSLTLLVLGFIFPRPSFAECKINPGVRCNLTSCAVGQLNYCCNTPAECNQLQNPDKGENGSLIPPGTNGNSSLQLCDGGTGIPTAIGCIPALGSQEQLFGFILKWAIGVGGGIAFLLIVYAGFMIMTSQGNPERLKAGQELLTGAISGIVLLALSVFVLNVIGVKILAIPGFGQ